MRSLQLLLLGVGTVSAALPPAYLSAPIQPTCSCSSGSSTEVRYCPEIVTSCGLSSAVPTNKNANHLVKLFSSKLLGSGLSQAKCLKTHKALLGYSLNSCTAPVPVVAKVALPLLGQNGHGQLKATKPPRTWMPGLQLTLPASTAKTSRFGQNGHGQWKSSKMGMLGQNGHGQYHPVVKSAHKKVSLIPAKGKSSKQNWVDMMTKLKAIARLYSIKLRKAKKVKKSGCVVKGKHTWCRKGKTWVRKSDGKIYTPKKTTASKMAAWKKLKSLLGNHVVLTYSRCIIKGSVKWCTSTAQHASSKCVKTASGTWMCPYRIGNSLHSSRAKSTKTTSYYNQAGRKCMRRGSQTYCWCSHHGMWMKQTSRAESHRSAGAIRMARAVHGAVFMGLFTCLLALLCRCCRRTKKTAVVSKQETAVKIPVTAVVLV